MRRPLIVLISLVLVVSVAACSSSGSDAGSKGTTTITGPSDANAKTSTTTKVTPSKASAADYRKALESAFTSGDPKQGQPAYTPKQANCAAPKWLKVLDVDRLKAKGIEPEALSQSDFSFGTVGLKESDAKAMVAASDSCGVDLAKESRKLILANLPEQLRACFEQGFGESDSRALLTEVLYRGGPTGDLKAKLDGIGQKCAPSSGGATLPSTPDSAGGATDPAAPTTGG